MPRTLTALRSPAPFSTAKSMIWLLQSLTLVSCLGPGNTVSQTSSTPLIVNGVLGESVTLILKFPVEEKITSITWLHDGKSAVFIEPNEALNRVTDPKRKNRLNVTESYSLHLSNLTMADSGHYRAQITTLTSLLFTSYDLRIFRRLRNLQVVPHTKWSNNRTCEILLTCSVENPNDNILFRWQVSGNTLQSEANLTISWDPKSFNEETYTCIAENPVSNSSFSVSVQSLCKSFFQFSTQQTQCPAETVRNLEYASFSPGSTVYAQVTHSKREIEIPKPVKNNDSTTIYSEVQQSQAKAHLFQDNCPSQCHVIR
ncbi:SLAM family member 6 isoform X3 [Phocoena sinus]|uniref:SLAM family member 6 isoform X3 n=1 Tax=Phocoena sinus TaxID=42100 RepID=UPI0013C4F010|nr:SLAM family member 6 isoform X3 [Phocoena sinus]